MYNIGIRVYSHICDFVRWRQLAEKEVVRIINVFFSGDYKPQFIILEGSANKKGHCWFPRVITKGSIGYYRSVHSFWIHTCWSACLTPHNFYKEFKDKSQEKIDMSMVPVPAESLTQLSTRYKSYHTPQKNVIWMIHWLGSFPVLLQGQSICGKNGECGRLSHIHHGKYYFYTSIS